MASETTTTSNTLIPFVYGDVKIQVSLETCQKFRTIANMFDDLDSTEIAPIPIQIDAHGQPVHFSMEELQIFINLFELRHNILKTEDDLFDIFRETNISFNLIKKCMILINFLDNQTFLDSLCKYTAFMIRCGKVNL